MFRLCTHGFAVYVLGVEEGTLDFVNVTVVEVQEAAQKGNLTKQMKFIM
jgi:hypothetical protein